MTKSEEEIIQTIKSIIRKGNDAEVKKVNGNIIVTEIHRKVNIKRPL